MLSLLTGILVCAIVFGEGEGGGGVGEGVGEGCKSLFGYREVYVLNWRAYGTV